METVANRKSVGVGEGGTAWDLRDVGENRRAVARRHDLLDAFLVMNSLHILTRLRNVESLIS